MHRYHYEAIGKDGKKFHGTTEAESTLHAVQELQGENGVTVIAVKTDAEIEELRAHEDRMRAERDALEQEKRRLAEERDRERIEAELKAAERSGKEHAWMQDYFTHGAAPAAGTKAGFFARLYQRLFGAKAAADAGAADAAAAAAAAATVPDGKTARAARFTFGMFGLGRRGKKSPDPVAIAEDPAITAAAPAKKTKSKRDWKLFTYRWNRTGKRGKQVRIEPAPVDGEVLEAPVTPEEHEVHAEGHPHSGHHHFSELFGGILVPHHKKESWLSFGTKKKDAAKKKASAKDVPVPASIAITKKKPKNGFFRMLFGGKAASHPGVMSDAVSSTAGANDAEHGDTSAGSSVGVGISAAAGAAATAVAATTKKRSFFARLFGIREDGTPSFLARWFGFGRKKKEGEKMDFTKSITKESARGIPGRANGPEYTAGKNVNLDMKNIDIKKMSFMQIMRKLLDDMKARRKESAEDRKKRMIEKAQAKLQRKKDAEEEKARKAAEKLRKAEEKKKKAADAKLQKELGTQTVLMGDKKKDAKPAPTGWLAKYFPFLANRFSTRKKMSFSMSEEEKEAERKKALLLIQGYKPTGNPVTDTINKINEWLIAHQGVKSKELVTFYTLMAVMINAGIPLVKSLQQLVEQQKNPRFKRILFQMVYEIENGKSLSKTMREFPDVFMDSQIGMVEAGEASGQLGAVMRRIAEDAEKSHAMLSKVKGALVYPITILVILVIVMIVVMIAIVPKVTEIFTTSGVTLPMSTRVLIWMSGALTQYWYILLAVTILIGFSFKTYTATEEGKYYWDFVKLKFPIFGVLFQKVALARFTRSLSTLSASGLSIIKALKINADSIGNEIYRQEVLATAESVKKGVSIAKDLDGNKLFPSMVVNMIAIGEETAQVANVSMKVAEFYDQEVDGMVKNMQSLMEPIIIVVVGIMVGGLVAAIMQPIMSLSEVATKG